MKIKLIFCALLLLGSIQVIAQKLPAVQQNSLRAPANIKVDGKATEWDNKFQANNHSVDLLYTISNDDEKLYLTVQAIYPDVILHILNGSLTFAVNPSGKKNDPQSIGITYPVISPANPFVANFKAKPQIIAGYPASVMEADSFMNVKNKRLMEVSKTIRTSGIKDVDTLISIYNNDGIKAAALFDNKMVYTYELSITLKDLGLSINTPTKFAYHIMINEVAERGGIIRDSNGNITAIRITKGQVTQAAQGATDMWGEYILAKK